MDEKQICFVCHNIYRKPVVFPCGHSFCKVCIQDILRTSPPEGHCSSQMGRKNQLDESWTGVDRMSRNIDPYRIKITKQNVDDNIQQGLGSQNGYGGWMRGSSSRGKTPSQEGEHSNTPSNRNHTTSVGSQNWSGESSRHLEWHSQNRSGESSRHLDWRSPNRSGESNRHLDWRGNCGTTGTGRVAEKRLAAAVVPKEHPTEYIEKKTKSLVDEYLQIHDLNEAVQCVKDLESPKSIHLFVSTALNHVLERSSKARTATGTLLNHLVKQTIVSAESYMKGLQETLQFAEDMQIDIPNIWQYLGELIGPMVQDGCLPPISLRRICEPLSSMAGILVAEILHDMARTLGHLKVGELWRSSRLQWSDFLKPGDNVDEFLGKHKLKFIQSAKHWSRGRKSLPLDKIWDELDRLIVKQNVANEEVINWIEANVGEAQVKEPAFIRALMTAICTSAITGEQKQCRVDKEIVKYRCVLLLKYLDHKEPLELQALYALQILVHQLGHPPSVLRMFFDIFYDKSIITKDAFNQWEKSTDPAERAGRSAAKTSVKQFFTWLLVTKKIPEIDWLFGSQNMANEEVIDWIEANVGEVQAKEPAFIRALMTAICTSAITGEGTQCRVDEEKVKKRRVLLLKYLDHKETLELQALYALQTLVHRLEHPPSVLRTFFDTFYDEDIISEDAFNQWEESTDPAEQAGKRVAKTSVIQFFTWLHEAEEDSSDCM